MKRAPFLAINFVKLRERNRKKTVLTEPPPATTQFPAGFQLLDCFPPLLISVRVKTETVVQNIRAKAEFG
ncbi:unnamed protein product [Caenorhabditis auriculariae]|uniref:Uncharacterized protein n=1 Tax=Caenorhabditis auriculariae TaxID=2777116 RepID=A0A8S1H786_9PELO|nr:unnamed protein product [Caenorhabditis auriculariae]